MTQKKAAIHVVSAWIAKRPTLRGGAAVPYQFNQAIMDASWDHRRSGPPPAPQLQVPDRPRARRGSEDDD